MSEEKNQTEYTFENVSIEKELRKSYLEYSLSVIIGRAIPDARDGLKPVHRRILYAQKELANYYNRAHKKCARIVGDVIGKYHPHGDSSVYDALVRLAQDFSMREPLVDGQGNFGSIDGDSAAAMRYTEARMTRLAGEFLADLDKETIDWRPNYDNTLPEPSVLPTKVPNLLLNGSSGIAVGMATNIPPHNLNELCDGLLVLLDNHDATVEDLMQHIKGPDFPTGGYVYVGKGLHDAFKKGRGSVKIRGKVDVESRKKGGESLIIREIPYGLNKSTLVEKIAFLVNDRKIEGVSDLRDESNHNGIRIVIDLKRGTIPDIVINSLYKFTSLETSFSYNLLAVVNNRPELLTLKSALSYFLEHRREVVIRRTRFDLRAAEARAHILEGLKIALDNIDEVVKIIRASKSTDEAKINLIERFNFSDKQADAILAMRLSRLTGLEHEKLLEEYNELLRNIAYYKSILEDETVLRGVIRTEIEELKNTYGNPRKTEIVYDDLESIDIEDLIPDDDVVITVSRRGYIKRTALDSYHQQKRGGKGIAGLHTSDDDFVQDMLTTSNHQVLLVFTNRGRMHQLKVHRVPEGSRTAKGVHIANLLPLDKEESVATVLSIRDFDEKSFLFATKGGMVKRSDAQLYAKSRKSGIQAVGMREDDELIAVREVRDDEHVVLTTQNGMAIRFSCRDVRSMGRTATGVKGIALRSGDRVVACVTLNENDEDATIMTVSSNGYGKRSKIDLYRLQSRGGKGVTNFKITNKTGNVIGAMTVVNSDALLLLTSGNKIIRIAANDINSIGRVTQGVRLVSMDDGGQVVCFDKIDDNSSDEDASKIQAAPESEPAPPAANTAAEDAESGNEE
ncbi:DNA gyrase subunit A [Desulfovibrio sp. OttesenSCG-928-F07]|nr:DNA gyrase subunit A [Desulfovibrio sp. OttesenSCG-928-F07]